MARTVTSTAVKNGPCLDLGPYVQAHTVVYGFEESGVSISASLTIKMIPIPHQARILQIHTTIYSAVNAGGFIIGDDSLTNRWVTLTSLSTSDHYQAINSGVYGYKVSLTASDVNAFETIDFMFTGAPTSTLTGCIHMTAVYYVDR